jgi:hypothetical protein
MFKPLEPLPFLMTPAEAELLRLFRGMSPALKYLLMDQVQVLADVRRRRPRKIPANVLHFRGPRAG